MCGGVGAWGDKKFVAVFPFRMDVTDAAANCPPIYVIFSSVLIEPVILLGNKNIEGNVNLKFIIPFAIVICLISIMNIIRQTSEFGLLL